MNPETSTELPLLIYANAEQVSDLYYLTGLMAPDPYFAIRNGEEIIVGVSPLEYGRAIKCEKPTRVIDIQSLSEKSQPLMDRGYSVEGANIIVVLQECGIKFVCVTRDFPHYLAEELAQAKIMISVYEGYQLKERVIKSNSEVENIRDAIRTTEKCFARVEEILASTIIENGMLRWQGEWLTSERVQQEIELVCLTLGARAEGTIVAGGDQGCDPHEEGHGVLYANQLIIADIFPRSKTHHYWGDMTRTFLKGKPTPEQIKLVDTVAEAQKLAIGKITEGVDSGSIHRDVEQYFEQQGYSTEIKDGVYQGFFHGTGHGFGLDIHEPPRLGKRQGATLKAGMIVTVEPGLYYPGIGGCRIEDDVLVTPDGCEVLSNYRYDWIIT